MDPHAQPEGGQREDQGTLPVGFGDDNRTGAGCYVGPSVDDLDGWRRSFPMSKTKSDTRHGRFADGTGRTVAATASFSYLDSVLQGTAALGER